MQDTGLYKFNQNKQETTITKDNNAGLYNIKVAWLRC